jgi:hypothetical protein
LAVKTALAARKLPTLAVDRQTENIDGDENMIRVHKSTNSKDAHMASASLNTSKRHFNSNLNLTNNFPRLTIKKLLFDEL